ncbi:uncharacterized protein BX663DRAFT_242617 [Cokeromyces recurvatus]|uniref:uncharacterized protein n=1 Tax=Cokeromyces recurvatus TaxID=90255 RepID=UPI00221F15CA|nr:uncharacterized protein BX663DRAFT_242617 [Cokeromyces recurvatus]KAI7905837.1 hypothetical protein BX663DRAFT_242617 [Cokeromyces recurvatus]
MGGVCNINKVKGPSKERSRRIAKSIKKGNRQPAVITTNRVITKKKQKKIEKALKYKYLASKGLIDYEEEMKDVVLPDPGKQRVITACIPSDEILAAAASGPGTTLGGPQ